MKSVIAILLTLCFCYQISYSQDKFTVIKVSGNIVIERTGYSLSIGTSFAQNENLLFKIPESRAAVINPQRGRYLLTSENSNEFRNSKSNFLPSTGKISTRTIFTGNNAGDLKEQFQGSCVILNENRILVDTTVFPLNNRKYFLMTYLYNNNTIIKKLPFKKDTLCINRNELLTLKGKIIPYSQIREMKIIYLEEDVSDASKLMCSFNPVFPDTRTLKDEVKIIIDQMKTRTYKEKFTEISAFITDFYGKVGAENLRIWLKNNLGLKQ